MTSLKTTIEQLAKSFADGVLTAIRTASLEDILAESGRGGSRAAAAALVSRGAAGRAAPPAPAKRGKGGRLARRSPEQLAEVVSSIVAALEKAKSGLRSEELQKVLGLSKKEITGPINEALAGKKIRKTGERRSTTYFAK